MDKNENIKDKDELKNFIKNNKNHLEKKDPKREETIQEIKDNLKAICKPKDPEKPAGEEQFKFACFVGSWRKYAYYMGNKNHIIVIRKEEGASFNKEESLNYGVLEKQYNHEILELSNGYIKTKFSTKFEDVEYSTDTDVYKYVEMAGWLTEEDYENALELRADESDRIEIHHINGDSTDNSVGNLIYIPNTIHCYIHTNKITNS